LLISSAMAGCGELDTPARSGEPRGAVRPLTTPCSINAQGVVSVTLEAGETVVMAVDSQDRLTVNLELCSTATLTTIKRVSVATAVLSSVTDELVTIEAAEILASRVLAPAPEAAA